MHEKRNAWVNFVWTAFRKKLLSGPKMSWADNIKPHVKRMYCDYKIIRKYRPIFSKVIGLDIANIK